MPYQHAINASLVSTRNIHKECLLRHSISTLHFLRTTSQLKKSFEMISRIHGDTDKPSAILHNFIAFNFMYCDHPQRTLGELSPIELFTTTAEFSVWLFLAIFFIMISLLIKIKIGKTHNSIVLATLSVLISFGTSGASRAIQSFWLFALWSVFSLLLGAHYTGGLPARL